MTPEPSPFLVGALHAIYDTPPAVCPDCGFVWGCTVEEARDAITGSNQRLRAILADRDGTVARPDGSWNATAYVWHLVDLARSWTERWVHLRAEPGSTIVGWDPDELADARGYRSLPTMAARWALSEAVEQFDTVTDTIDPAIVFEHGDWGTGTVGDGIRWLAHEFQHHVLDVDERAAPRTDGSAQ